MEREGSPNASKSRGRDPVPEQDNRLDSVVLARNPDQAIDLIVGKIERPSPGGGPRILLLRDFDELPPANSQTAKPESEELGQIQIPGRAYRREEQRIQHRPADSLGGSPNRDVVENGLRQGAVRVLGRVEDRNQIPMIILEGMKTSRSQPRIEAGRSEPGVVAAEEKTVLLPSEEERLEQIWERRVRDSRRQAQQPLVLLLV
jgi:hypothetical protein